MTDSPEPHGRAPDIPDGTYDVFVFDAEDDESDPDLLRLGVTILAGERKGDVVALAARGLGVDSIDAIGMPGTLTVVDGRPTLRIDDV